MAQQFTCTYANCQKTTVPIIITMPDERARFCCADHAMVAMVRRARLAAMHGSFKDLELGKVEKQLQTLVGDGS